MNHRHFHPFVLLFLALFLFACSGDGPNGDRQFGIFSVLQDDRTVSMDGTIDSNSLLDFQDLVAEFPGVDSLVMINCDGSMDDEVNLQLSAFVHQRGMNFHLNDNATIASGGTDFFLAGVTRTRGTNTRVGVHSWGSDNDKATDYPQGHAFHLPYINYYVSVGFSQQLAEDFYYFTIYAASPEDIHWMTEAELSQYGFYTN